MSHEETTEVRFDGQAEDKAILLLAAAQEQGLDASVVRTTSNGFIVPKSLADKVSGDVEKQAAKVREERGEVQDFETRTTGPGPTGRVGSNSGEAEQGTVQQTEQAKSSMGEPTADEQGEPQRKRRSRKQTEDKNKDQE